MAKEITSVVPKTKTSIGGLWLVTGEVTRGTEYETKGDKFTATQLQELGLTNGIVFGGWVNQQVGVSNLTGFAGIVVEGLPGEAQTVRLQEYVLGTATAKKPFKEVAEGAEEVASNKFIVTLIGK